MLIRQAARRREGLENMESEKTKSEKPEIDESKLHAIRSGLENRDILIVWKPEYELGIFIVDEQHRGIITVINSLYHAMRTDQGVAMLLPVIGMVTEYTRLHFVMEEAFHEQCGFTETEQHRVFHGELIAKMTKIGRRSVAGKDPYPFMQFLKEWWHHHICHEDRLFRDYLAKTLAEAREKRRD